MTWHHLNYLLGLHQMGHEVWFLEDSGSYAIPYNPKTWSVDVDSSYGRQYLIDTFNVYGLPLRWCYYSEFEDQYYGMTRQELNDLLKSADLLLCVSAVTPLRDGRPRPRRTCVIDTDPVFTQLRMERDPQFLEYYRSFDHAATFARLIGQPCCPLPLHGLDWIPTNQPLALEHWPVVRAASRRFTTIGRWEHSSERHVEHRGRKYLSSKGVEWMKLIDLPRHTSWELHLGMQQFHGPVRERFEAHGWKLFDPEQASESCQSFQAFIQQSAGELTVAKEIYAGLPSGWFSDRSACYLASGRPVITQESGFSRWLPVGQGLFSFNTMEEASAALRAIDQDYATHARAARAIAERFFDARTVLQDLLDHVM
jgi:hypothetical protein